jgi:membrane fusion protein, heavy metal efflux system
LGPPPSPADFGWSSDYPPPQRLANEDRSTPIFSPYAGRVTRLLAKPGEMIQRGQPLFVVEATDMVQAQNDFIAAITVMNKALLKGKGSPAVFRAKVNSL